VAIDPHSLARQNALLERYRLFSICFLERKEEPQSGDSHEQLYTVIPVSSTDRRNGDRAM
jgi:hypothetical protein